MENKYHLGWKTLRKGEIASYKQFLLFSQCLQKLYIFSESKCDIVWQWFKRS